MALRLSPCSRTSAVSTPRQSPYVMTVTWLIASGIILHHRSNAYELFLYFPSLIYFSVATVTITIKPKLLLLLPLPLLSYYFATKYFAADIKFPGVVELKSQLLILKNILWLPLCRTNKFGLNTLPSKVVAIPDTCGLSLMLRDDVVLNYERRKCRHRTTKVSRGSAAGATMIDVCAIGLTWTMIGASTLSSRRPSMLKWYTTTTSVFFVIKHDFNYFNV